MEAFPEAKVLLTVRAPDTWYESVKNSIYQFHIKRQHSLTMHLFHKVMGMGRKLDTIRSITMHVSPGFQRGPISAHTFMWFVCCLHKIGFLFSCYRNDGHNWSWPRSQWEFLQPMGGRGQGSRAQRQTPCVLRQGGMGTTLQVSWWVLLQFIFRLLC